MEKQNSDWIQEQDRLEDALKVIESKKAAIESMVGSFKSEIVDLRKSFWEDVTVNLDEPDDVIETFQSIKQQSELIGERERNHRQIFKQIKILERLKESPYFGRFDFAENGETSEEKIYIGIASLLDKNEEDFLIFDWRAPISSMYYDYYPGPAQYETHFETIDGEMTLKRQFIIKNGKLKSMFDTGVTIGDEMLQQVLGNNANTQMKSIVATIQREQNKIIRNEKSRYLIVQGVAGSGKTSAALQRVAYLLYRYREQLSSNNIMLFSPNPLFNSYVATVLPELGEENMQQSTFQEYVEHRLGGLFDIEDPFSQMEYLLTEMDQPNYDVRLQAIHYKANLDFKELIQTYVKELSEHGILFKNIGFKKKKMISKETIQEYFYSLDPSISIPNRLSKVTEWLMKEVVKFERKERKKDWVLQEAELMEKEDHLEIFKQLQKKQEFSNDTFDDYEREEKLIAKEIVRKHFKPIKAAIKKLDYLDRKGIYKQLFSHTKEHQVTEKWNEICSSTIEKLTQNRLNYEDAIPFLYLQDLIEGKQSNTNIRHLFIDEAQDYSPFQFEYLKQLFPNCRMTILGDYNQAIYAHSMNAPTLLSPELYEEDKSEVILLKKSYRSTKEIVDFSKGIVAAGNEIEPFNRSGALPLFKEVETKEDLHKEILTKIKALQGQGHETIAVICKTNAESKEAFNALKDEAQVRLMNQETYQFDKGVLVLPTYLAKGIEFDAVIIYNASNEVYGREYERKLFYTACTRAMHELQLFSIGERSFFFNGIGKEDYIEV
ncbi:RNA polymerase recycling motor HelD [Bacillus sp. REN16]|uniref:RNA polymerase recycling motor HelD n=1 Tax=Bacillus sp. REN16 TaxID=2887296 RepID=UPI001E4641C8|nr:RNA polymerase recycling motor HelD [Bacillus sp. REN16]MCC3355324.1 AAA family ATPase [Bacillus sp. REN16]